MNIFIPINQETQNLALQNFFAGLRLNIHKQCEIFNRLDVMEAARVLLQDRPPHPGATGSLESGSNSHLNPLPPEEGFLDTQADMAPVVVIGPLLGTERLLPAYKPLLAGASELPADERFFPVPERGLGRHESMYGRLESQIAATYERVGRPIVVAGHSLGALMATKFGVNNPEMVADVICLAGAQEGIKRETPASFALARLLGSPPGRRLLQHDSDHMMEHKEKVARDWAPEVGLHLISPTVDDLLVLPQGLGLELPAGQKPERRVVGWPGMTWLLRLIPDMPKDTKVLRSLIFADHYNIPLNPAVIGYTRAVRRAAALGVQAAEIDLPEPSFQPLPAAA